MYRMKFDIKKKTKKIEINIMKTNSIFQVGIIHNGEGANDTEWNSDSADKLLEITNKSKGLSGRSLRKLPLLAHAWYIHRDSVDLQTYLYALDDAIIKHMADTITIEKQAKK